MKTTMTNLKKYFLDLIRPQELDAIREEEKAKGNDKLMADLECLWNEETWRELSLDIADRRSLDMSKKAVFGMIDKSSSTNNPGKRESGGIAACLHRRGGIVDIHLPFGLEATRAQRVAYVKRRGDTYQPRRHHFG